MKSNNMPSYKKHHSGRRSEETMEDDSDDKDSKRKSRNLSEKKRRDQFNLLVNELSSMVSTSGRKMDKSTVLKSTISFLKNHNELSVRSRANEIQEDWKPTFLTNEEFTHLVLEAVDGFIIVFSTSGQIYYVSESITSLLGYLPKDVLDMTIFQLACEEDHTVLYDILSHYKEDESQVSFSCHLRISGQDSSYCELVHFIGYFRPDEDMSTNGDSTPNEADLRSVFVGTAKVQTPLLIKEMPHLVDSSRTEFTSRHSLEWKFLFLDHRASPIIGSVFVGTAKVQTPLLIKEMPHLVDSSRTEFTSRHSLEWKFLFLDHRASPIIGYLPFELLGTSGYEYYHVDDLDKVIDCHESLMEKGEGTSCYYRFLTKGQQWIWLQTRFYITYHQWNSKPEFVVCTHRVVSYLDVLKRDKTSEEECQAVEVQWRKKTSKKKPDLDCRSMSADSPGSRQSTVTEKSVKSRISQIGTGLQSPQPPSPRPSLTTVQPQQQRQNSPQFLDPTQYVAAIPLQPVIAGYSPNSAVLSPLPVDSLPLSPLHNQLQVDLQRKQAELQASIGHQQQELRRISEQLLMARLGLLQQQATSSIPNYHQSNTSSATVSSTTAPVPILPASVTPSVVVSVTAPISVTIPSLYTSPDSNSQNK